MTRRDIDTSDLQAIAKTGFASLTAASYMLLRVVEPSAARRWLRDLAPASLAKPSELKTTLDIERKTGAETYQVAFTAAGLRKLGVDESIMQRFSPEFVEGMAGDENRSRRLGDIGENAPEKWCWGVGDKEPHILDPVATDAGRSRRWSIRCCSRRWSWPVEDRYPATSDMGLEPFAAMAARNRFDQDRLTRAQPISTTPICWRSARFWIETNAC